MFLFGDFSAEKAQKAGALYALKKKKAPRVIRSEGTLKVKAWPRLFGKV